MGRGLPKLELMRTTLIIRDQFCQHAAAVRQSFLESGFGAWRPNKGAVGSSVYDGMNWKGAHGIMLRSLSAALGCAVFPNTMFARITTPEMERAYIHSDREDGDWTCICYLSDHEEVSGTGFYRHRATGLLEMPEMADLQDGQHEQLKRDMVIGDKNEWEQTDFVRGIFNRAVIFHAPLFHARIPMFGVGAQDKPEAARMIWACHFST